jgi:hypothetical protein
MDIPSHAIHHRQEILLQFAWNDVKLQVGMNINQSTKRFMLSFLFLFFSLSKMST